MEKHGVIIAVYMRKYIDINSKNTKEEFFKCEKDS